MPKNCPKEISRKKVGMPAPNRHRRYGIKNAPDVF
jgi:hypothetical protein